MTSSRTTDQRRQDALYRLGHDVDAWVATTDTDTGAPRLTPLSFLWHDDALLFATPAAGPTGRNLASNPSVQVGVGLTRDVVLVQATVDVLPAVSDELGDAFALKTGFDPRTLSTAYLYFRLTPRTIQVWREEEELADRWVMRDGEWR
ncbi:pyridoxamine 5'-phosphate oxidase family protein [Cellulomonas sp. Leaf334]|uniref:pyridoxamine 5'-phosphate oxidase family protein n=1 Tax=Cellulomonas sp. Leaf334 TaxID=1736339 RepID=UPI0006FB4167|nr:pyridoxamine 5'-phosphate oxidase family protein [Cellulomonas sp. Leaf334]KQR17637.1 pyridoxamine 5'-phosphate oxidase [Cellulomonas sp. Leaf334]